MNLKQRGRNGVGARAAWMATLGLLTTGLACEPTSSGWLAEAREATRAESGSGIHHSPQGGRGRGRHGDERPPSCDAAGQGGRGDTPPDGGAMDGGAGGRAGAPGTVGDAGGTGGALSSCPRFVPTTPLLTGAIDTSAAPSATYSYAAPGLIAPVVVSTYDGGGVWQTLEVTAAPGIPTDANNAWSGFGVPVFGCLDARAYSGIKFTVEGDLGTCVLTMTIVARDNNSVLYGGACAADPCLAPQSPPVGLGTTTVRFSDLTGGSPDPVLDPSQINDIDWHLTAPSDNVSVPCSAVFRISQLSFVSP